MFGEREDVPNVGTAPLIDGLLVVTNHADLDLGAGQELNQPLLRGVHVLVLVNDQVAEFCVHLGRELWAF